MLKRSKKIMYISHCVLNQNSVIRDWERSKGAFKRVIDEIMKKDIGIIQLPCPEFTYLGENRPPKTKTEYDEKEYRKICKELSKTIVIEMKKYIDSEYEIVGILGIENSPSCDIIKNRGIFMEELFYLLKIENIDLKTFEIKETYVEEI